MLFSNTAYCVYGDYGNRYIRRSIFPWQKDICETSGDFVGGKYGKNDSI